MRLEQKINEFKDLEVKIIKTTRYCVKYSRKIKKTKKERKGSA